MKLTEQVHANVEPHLLRFLRDVARKVNALASGTYSARDGQRSAAPTTGTWARGDFVENDSKAELGSAGSKYVIQGWDCVSGGTPGTWLERRTLTGN